MMVKRIDEKFAEALHKAGCCFCYECEHAKPVIYRGEEIADLYRCGYIKMNTDLFDIDFCRYSKRKEK